MKRAVIAILGSVLAAAYWWSVFTIVHAGLLFAGDRDPASQPAPDHEVLTRNGLIILGAVLVFAALSVIWHRVMKRFQRGT
ncbi:hypothetical protein [Allosphingosinicella deserti]|uniref:Uncharacterized protein n=1 Tax=Allosphingosinicella deserti TaxID=2116704 RepID=A0A2P7QNK6_9SPHN|nr:hypothetical protein [Sphingomonas deserti]PSJ39553.1 hypothetical protein C7I55_13175 [Sphingomonas deserti]